MHAERCYCLMEWCHLTYEDPLSDTLCVQLQQEQAILNLCIALCHHTEPLIMSQNNQFSIGNQLEIG